MTITEIEAIEHLDFDHVIDCERDGCTQDAAWVNKPACNIDPALLCDSHMEKWHKAADSKFSNHILVLCYGCQKAVDKGHWTQTPL